MNRTLKQLAFGFFYLAILGLVVGGSYYFLIKPAPSCFDNKQNQGETAIDCGGPCTLCELKDLQLVTEGIRFFTAGEVRTTLLAKVANPSQNYGASFKYEFEVKSLQNNSLDSFEGVSKIAPQEVKYITIPAASFDRRDVGDSVFKIVELNWDIEKKEPNYPTRLSVRTNVGETGITVTGTFSNDSASNLLAVRITAVLFDKQNNILNASVTKIEKISAFSGRSFTIFFPRIAGLPQNIDSEKTQVFWEPAD